MHLKIILKILGAIFFILGLHQTSFAQNSSVLKGKIEANNSDVEKIHIINLNLEKGVITDAKGNFQIVANEKDSLYVSSIQFENKTVIVTPEMIKTGKIDISLKNKMNELAEIVIDDIKLSGYLANDLNKISLKNVETKNRLQNNLNTYIKKDKQLNPYQKPNPLGGIRVDKIAGAVIRKLSKNSKTPINYSPEELVHKSIQIVGREFFRENLKLNETEIYNFVNFCAEDASFRTVVIENNALVLIEYFQHKIEDFKTRRGTVLNQERTIPG